MESPPRGALIVTEGMDGAGKTTQADLIEQWCHRTMPDRTVHRRKEPGSSLNGDLRKMLFHSDYSKSLNQVTAGILFFLDHYNNALFCQEAVDAGDIVISDRWCYSQYAYDDVKEVSNTTSLRLYREFERTQIKPDLVMCFEVPSKVADARLLARIKSTAQSDKQWGERGDLSEKVRRAYRDLTNHYQPSADVGLWVLAITTGEWKPTKQFEMQVEPRLQELFHV